MGRVTAGVSGGCLIATSVVMLLFYVKNYIGTHGKELGILKALGYSNGKIAGNFWIFGLPILVGCAAGFATGSLYLPTFCQKQASSLQSLRPEFHPLHIGRLPARFLPRLCAGYGVSVRPAAADGVGGVRGY